MGSWADHVVGAGDVYPLLKGKTIELPTCPKCAVLWDEALALIQSIKSFARVHMESNTLLDH